MAIYTTFFLCKAEELPARFPGWRLPLSTPVRRRRKNPFTGETVTFETREPEWPNEQEDLFAPDYQVVAIKGNYQDYLEGRLPPSVRSCPHWAAKGLMEHELAPLAEAVGVEPKFDFPLYGPPSAGILQELPPDMVLKLVALDQAGLDAVAEKWARKMSTPEYTHSAAGEKIDDGWTAGEAMEILRPLVALARQATSSQRMYLLIEA